MVASKKRAAKKSGRKGRGAGDGDFTSGDRNDNVRDISEGAGKKGGKLKPQRLIEDSGIPELDQIGIEYAEIRDARIELNRRETDLKARVKGAMHKHKKEVYDYAGVHIEIIPGEEDVKVKIDKKKEGE